MSALPLKADMCGATWDVRFVPKANSCTAVLFDHLVGESEQLVGNCETKCLGGLTVGGAGECGVVKRPEIDLS